MKPIDTEHGRIAFESTSLLMNKDYSYLAVLIAIENFINIRMYLNSNVIPVCLVIATALMAIALKVIIFDFEGITPDFVYATAAVVLALDITYWLITKKA